ncbi:MAG: anti-sigma factor, partial [Chloroflexi bacterium]|nr:anti-sigma factor [Chloroflexota bacterium]
MSKLLIIFGLVLLMTVPVSFAQAQQAFEGSGSAVISDSLTLSDKITYSLTGVTRLAPDQSYEGWLVNSGTGALQSTGLMTVDGSSKISHSWVSPDGDNLIEDYDTVVISVEPVPDSDPGSPSNIKPFSASISPEAMTHIRHLLVSWPEGDDAGILTNLNIQLDVAIQHVDLARNSATLDDVLLHTQHIINVVDGDGSPSDGIGIVAHAQDRKHAGFAGPSVAAEGANVEAAGANAEKWALEAKDGAEDILGLDSIILAKTLLSTTVAGPLDAA